MQIVRGHYHSLPYSGRHRSLRGCELRVKLNGRRDRFIRLAVNGIHRQPTGFHWSHYRRHCWHLSLDWRGVRGITLSYGRYLW